MCFVFRWPVFSQSIGKIVNVWVCKKFKKKILVVYFKKCLRQAKVNSDSGRISVVVGLIRYRVEFGNGPQFLKEISWHGNSSLNNCRCYFSVCFVKLLDGLTLYLERLYRNKAVKNSLETFKRWIVQLCVHCCQFQLYI